MSGELMLVTGGAGFIGSCLAERLLDRGYRVRVLDNLIYGKAKWVPSAAEFLQGDITDRETCGRACIGVSGVFHAAAMSRAAPSLDAIEECTQQNIVGTQNMLIAARAAGVRKFIYSGSSTYYGNQPGPHREQMRPDLLNFYALSKYAGEEYCRLFDRALGLPTIILRYFNVYGPRQPETGSYALVLGIFLRRWRDGQSLEIHGDGGQRRDFIQVRDVADCNIAAYESSVRGEVLNVGSGVNISVKELADRISPNQIFAPRRAGDAEVTLADISRTTAALGWLPRISFDEGLEELKRIMQEESQ
ncbi:MAG TPA: NAD-dependent epimerase/dehydratase family protein [Candidatus Binataceae bacterium]|nr:NAD-dependent epimerase/dehydratase family protein [Candidatus Binataceae bacterium]